MAAIIVGSCGDDSTSEVANHEEITSLISSRTMPPWPAGGDSPPFREDRSLREDQIAAAMAAAVERHEHEIGSWFKLTLNPVRPDEMCFATIATRPS